MTSGQQTQICEYLTFILAKKTKLPALTTGSFLYLRTGFQRSNLITQFCSLNKV